MPLKIRFPQLRGIQALLIGLAFLLVATRPACAQAADLINPNASDRVRVLAVQADGKILVGGDFATLGGLPRGRIARLNVDGSVDTGFNPNANGFVCSIVVQADGKILVGGGFTTVGGLARNHIARLNADGSLDPGFNPDADDVVVSVAVQADGKILIGGLFGYVGGQNYYAIARLNANGSVDTGFAVETNFQLSCIVVQADGKILVGGSFTSFGGWERNRIARLNADGSLDLGFNPNANNGVHSLVVQADGKILVGGFFSTIGGQTRNMIARLSADGSLDTSFNANVSAISGSVTSLAVQADGKIIIAGRYTAVGGQPRNNIARLNADGGVDPGFNPNANDSVISLALQPDGKVLVGGIFTTVGGQPRNRIARLTNNTAATSTLAVIGTGQIDWARGGSAPELNRVTFERWTGSSWATLGNAIRTIGGWRMTGLALPTSGQIRARGTTSGGANNGSSGLAEQTANYSLSFSEAWRYQYFGITFNTGDAADDADPDHDDICNLLERAFNLNPTQAGAPILPPGTGISGVPSITTTGTDASLHLKIEFLRRKASSNSGLTYTPQFATDLGDTWQLATGVETVESIDADWERVTIEDVASGQPVSFGRVRVSN